MNKKNNKKTNKPTKKTEEVKKEDLFEVEYLNRWQLIWRALKKHKLGIISMWILLIFYLVAIFANFLSPYNPYAQNQDLSYSPPSNIRWFDEEGKLTWPYVYPYVLERDPQTYRTSFSEGTSLQHITAEDLKTGEISEFTIGEENVNSIYLVVETTQYAEDTEGNIAQLTTRPVYKVVESLKLSEVGILEGPLRTEREDPNYLKNLPTWQYPGLKEIGEPVKLITEKRLHRIYAITKDEIKEVVKEAIVIVNDVLDVEGGDLELARSYLSEFAVDPDLFEVAQKPKVIEYKTRKFPIKFFIRSWEYKLLWLIPSDIHLFGVETPAEVHLFGGDAYGRDVFSRILFGSRISLSIGILGIIITFTLGLIIGGAAGYYGGWADEISMRSTEILMSIPGFYLLISLRAILPVGLPPHITYLLIVVILSFIGWPGMSRVIRGMVLSLKSNEFVEAAMAMGYPDRRVIWKHIIPNTSTYIIVAATLSIPQYIIGEAGLSFLGLGISEPSASWGLMLSQAQNIKSMTEAPWLLVPGLFIFIVVMAFNLLGDALRDALDPRALGI
ncbi:MAG: ABC transporter permease subunit [Thermotogota bacterium]|nr:ABC transporter permease subunit [Thermotogota bacterium]